MPTIQDIEQEIIQEFSAFEDWMEKYEYIIELGKELPLIDPALKTDDKLIRGCQSQVWLHAEKVGNELIFTADSDAIITKGLIALLIRVLSKQKPQAILETKLGFIAAIGLQEHLSPTRANGLLSMVQRMKQYAIQLA